jgi:hypothetical protein
MPPAPCDESPEPHVPGSTYQLAQRQGDEKYWAPGREFERAAPPTVLRIDRASDDVRNLGATAEGTETMVSG